jgi:hypothetical protein
VNGGVFVTVLAFAFHGALAAHCNPYAGYVYQHYRDSGWAVIALLFYRVRQSRVFDAFAGLERNMEAAERGCAAKRRCDSRVAFTYRLPSTSRTFARACSRGPAHNQHRLRVQRPHLLV